MTDSSEYIKAQKHYEDMLAQKRKLDADLVDSRYYERAEGIAHRYTGAKLTPVTLNALKAECHHLAQELSSLTYYEYEVMLFYSEDLAAFSMGYRIKPDFDFEVTLPYISGYTRLLPVYNTQEPPLDEPRYFCEFYDCDGEMFTNAPPETCPTCHRHGWREFQNGIR